jgi:hypothetical protein
MALKTGGLTAFREGLTGVLDRTMFRAAGYVLEIADQIVPVDEGDLKSSGRREPEGLNGSAEYRVAYGNRAGPNKFVDYQRYVESDQPYLGIAVREVDISAIAREELEALARKVRS